MTRLESLVTLNAARGIGSVLYERLIRHFGGVEEIFKSSQGRLEKVPGIGPKLAAEIIKTHQEDRGKKELDLAGKSGIRIITHEDADYPKGLKTIFDYPIVLYIKGELKPADNLAVAVVGSRRSSYYGQLQAEKISYALALRGLCVISGLARGIDSYAHSGALKAKGGRTIAVLGCGLNRIYPPENEKLFRRIADSGAVISELPLNTPPDSRNFPTRNRIISGLSLGVVVVEAPRRSGALITADLALDQGREVFAIPGKIDRLSSQGCHQLIKMGAKLVEDVDDIIEELAQHLPASPAGGPGREESSPYGSKQGLSSRVGAGLDYKEKVLFELLDIDEPQNIDKIILDSKLPPALVSSTLLTMELKKYVRQLPGKNFVRM